MMPKNWIGIAAVSVALSIATFSEVMFAQAGRNTESSTLLPARGVPTAPIVILLFSDFECPYCARVESVLQQVRKEFEKEVQIVFKHAPLPMHARAPLA